MIFHIFILIHLALRLDFVRELVRNAVIVIILNYADCDVRAVVGNSLDARENIGENEAVFDCAAALLKPCDMAVAHFEAQLVHNLLKRLDAFCRLEVVFDKRRYSHRDDVVYSGKQNLRLGDCIVGEGDFLLGKLLRRFAYIHRVVGHTLEIAD